MPLPLSLHGVLRGVADRPGAALAATLLLSLALGLPMVDLREGGLRFRIETEVEKILPERGPARRHYADFVERFGSDETVFVGLVDDALFSAEGVRRVDRVTKAIEAVEGVREVVSLATATDVRSVGGERVVVEAPFDAVPEDEAAERRLRERVLGNPLWVGNLVSRDGRAAAFLVTPEALSEAEFRRREIDRRIEAAAREAADPAPVFLAGNPTVKAATSRILLRDLFRLVPLGYVLMALIAFLAFRSVRGVVVPLAAIALAQLWTLGAMVLAERALNLVTFIVPPLINAVGFAYAAHVVSEHREATREGAGGREASYRALRGVGFPVLLTALTTAAGFGSLCLSELAAIREFGAFCMAGVAASLVAALVFAPALLALWPARSGAAPARAPDRLERWAACVARADVRHRRPILVAGALVAVLAAVGVARIRVDTSLVENLKPSDPVRRSIEQLDRTLGGSTTLHVLVDAGRRNAFKEPGALRTLRELQTWLEAQPEVASTSSLADHLMLVNRAFHGGAPASYAVPESKRLVSQYLFFLWDSRLDRVADRRFQRAVVVLRCTAQSSSGFARLLDRIEARLGTLPAGFEAYVTGDTALIARTVDTISRGQALSLSGAVAIIYLILLLYFRSPATAGLALVPNALPVLVYFGTLGWTGVTLNIITSLIACIVLGIAVDDTIHLLVRHRERRRLGDGREQAVVEALRSVARPVTATSVALCGGFLVLTASGLRHQVEFGWLAATMLLFAWLVDMTFSPALCASMHRERPERERPPGLRAGCEALHTPPGASGVILSLRSKEETMTLTPADRFGPTRGAAAAPPRHEP